jgi:Histidine kinase
MKALPHARMLSPQRGRVALGVAIAVALALTVLALVQYAVNAIVFAAMPAMMADAPGLMDLLRLNVANALAWMLSLALLFRMVPGFALRTDHIGPRWVGFWGAAITAIALLQAFVSASLELLRHRLVGAPADEMLRMAGADGAWPQFLLEAGRSFSESVWLALLSAAIVLTVAHRRETQRQRIRNAELALHLSRARMEALTARLNPHFLFNALHTVSALVHIDPDRAVGGIARLGQVLRTSIDRSEYHIVALREEVEFARDYLAIESLRFGERLDCAWRIDRLVADVPVPPFLLQPLIENAVKYGLGGARGTTRIGIEARVQDEHLYIEVTHRSEGVADGAATRDGTGFGLRNLRERLDALYGADAWLIRQTLATDASETVLILPLRPLPPPIPGEGEDEGKPGDGVADKSRRHDSVPADRIPHDTVRHDRERGESAASGPPTKRRS